MIQLLFSNVSWSASQLLMLGFSGTCGTIWILHRVCDRSFLASWYFFLLLFPFFRQRWKGDSLCQGDRCLRVSSRRSRPRVEAFNFFNVVCSAERRYYFPGAFDDLYDTWRSASTILIFRKLDVQNWLSLYEFLDWFVLGLDQSWGLRQGFVPGRC